MYNSNYKIPASCWMSKEALYHIHTYNGREYTAMQCTCFEFQLITAAKVLKIYNASILPRPACLIILVRLTISDSAVVCVPPGLAPGSPLSLIVAMSTAPSCECAGVSLHPITESIPQ